MVAADSRARVLVVIPTYDEAENVRSIVARVRAAAPAVDVLVADDNSPDGTGAIADDLSETDGRVHVLHRPGKQGLGAAYLAAFAWALQRGYDVVVEMDADGSHQPEQLPLILGQLRGADAVLGSRWVAGGHVHNWPRSREALSRAANLYVRLALGLPVRDATGGYRALRTDALRQLDLPSVASQGYCFQVDLVRRAHQRGLRVVEVPILFTEREHGRSKMSGSVIREALLRVTLWGLQDLGRVWSTGRAVDARRAGVPTGTRARRRTAASA
ncbi:MAG: polyprenol monophosphomannose synthase [Actinomycetes bacterium]